MPYFDQRPGPFDLEDEVIEQATVVRARPEHGAENSATYFVDRDRAAGDLPVLSRTTNPDHLFDRDDGIAMAGRTYRQWRSSDEFDPSATWETPANYNLRGRAQERPHADDLRDAVILERCEPGGVCRDRREVGVRIHGGLSRVHMQKSLRLYARNDDGEPRFDAPFFGDDGPVHHRRMVLRNSGNDNRHLMFADGFVQPLMGHLHADTLAYEPTVLFLNGEYWGIHNLRERYDRHYLEVVHGADPDRVQILDNSSGPLTADLPDAEETWRSFLDEVVGVEPGTPEFRAAVDRTIDIESFYDWAIAHLATGNRDSISNNTRLWREPQGPDGPGDGPRDGRWRWLIADFDHLGGGMGSYDIDFDLFETRLAPVDDSGFRGRFPLLMDRMLADDRLRDRFIDRFPDHLNTSFRPERATAELDELVRSLEGEMARHVARWPIFTMTEWYARIEQMREFLTERPAALLAARFGLGDTVTVHVRHDVGAGAVTLNTIALTDATPGVADPGSWSGSYADGRAVSLRATPRGGNRFVRWDGLPPDIDADHAEIEVVLDGDLTVEPVFDAY